MINQEGISLPALRQHTVSGVAIGFAAILLSGAVSSGPQVGEKVPDFQLRDQDQKPQTLASILGPKGALLVFYRSADW